MAILLSQYTLIGHGCVTLKSVNKCFNQVISQQVESMALYSASAEKCEIVVCFLVFHEIGDSLSQMQYQVIDL